ncbi:MAG TPA: hypothetical protein VKZ63_12675, partial [Kofleriaceae bacterium]|nr:hypothetical protein [Kofleriaceae bacterium]
MRPASRRPPARPKQRAAIGRTRAGTRARLARPAGRRAAALRQRATRDPVRQIRQHIDSLWSSSLLRGPDTLMQALQDPKLPFDATPTLYISHRESPERVRAELRRHLGKDANRIEIRALPRRGFRVPEHGLL